MSYIEKEDEDEKKIQKEDIKLENALAVMIKEDTTVETAQDIIDKDSDSERRNEFKKAEEIISALDPETTKKKKKARKEKEKEEFEKNLAFTRQNELSRQKQQEQDKQRIQEQNDKGIERGE